MMEHSKLSYRMWLMAIHLVTATKKSFSALELQRQLGHSRYEPVWYMLHKIRSVLGKRDANYKLAGAKIDPAATVHTDGLASYNVLAPLAGSHHVTLANDPKHTSKLFPWVHTVISNAKRVILGIHHSVHSPYLQNYLSEFCWKFNRRRDQKNQFARLLHIGLQLRWC